MNWLELVDPGVTIGAGGLGALVLRYAGRLIASRIAELINTLADLRSEIEKLHVKLDAHMADDASRHEASQESMREIWGALGVRSRR